MLAEARRRLPEDRVQLLRVDAMDPAASGIEGPFDAIIVTAAAPEVPQPLVAQLAEGASLVAPIGPAGYQELVRVTKQGEKTKGKNPG